MINDRECVIVLKYLLSMLLANSNRTYITSSELRNNLNKYTNIDYSAQYFKTKIIVKLRDSNVLIANSSKGYKIPKSEENLLRFFNHTNSMLQPMIARTKRARDRVKTAANGELDILNRESLKELKKIIDDKTE